MTMMDPDDGGSSTLKKYLQKKKMLDETTAKPPLSTGFVSLDTLLHGGWVSGAFNLLHGNAGAFKTTISLSAAVEATKQKKDVLYINFDGKASGEAIGAYAESIGVDLNYFSILSTAHEHTPNALLVADAVLTLLLDLKARANLGLIIIDTLTSVNWEGELSMKEKMFGASARSNGIFINRLSDEIIRRQICVILLAHTREIKELRYTLYEPKGGNAASKYSTIILHATKSSKYEEKNGSGITYSTITLTVQKSQVPSVLEKSKAQITFTTDEVLGVSYNPLNDIVTAVINKGIILNSKGEFFTGQGKAYYRGDAIGSGRKGVALWILEMTEEERERIAKEAFSGKSAYVENTADAGEISELVEGTGEYE